MGTDLQLAWVDVGDRWTPSRPFPMKLRLTNAGSRELDTNVLEGPNPALGFSVSREGEEPRWHAGPEASELAGLTGSQGLLTRSVLGPGSSWETREELSHYWLTPAPGQYLLRARYASGLGVVFAQEKRIEVTPAGLKAADASREEASEPLLVHAWGDGADLWLRIAPGGYPLAPRYLQPGGKWPGRGTIRVAQQSFSPLADPPVSAYRFWSVWLNRENLGGALVDYLGVRQATFQEGIEDGDLLTPVQSEDGSLLVPVLTKRDVLAWFQVEPKGGRASRWAEWPVPTGLAPTAVAAHPSGSVAVLWEDSPRRRVCATFGRLERKAPPVKELARFDSGRVAHVLVLDQRRGPDLLLLRVQEVDGSVVLNLHRRGPEPEDLGSLRVPSEVTPIGFRAAWVPRSGPVVVMNDEAGRLWAAPGMPGGEWKQVGDLRADRGFGIAGGPNGVVVWAADEELGLRFAPVALF